MIADDADGLVAAFRFEVADAVPDASSGEYGRLWKDVEIYGYLTEACDKLARDLGGLFEVSRIGFAAGDLTVPLPAHVLKIRSARLVTANTPVVVGNANGPRNTIYRDYGIVMPSTMFNTTGRPIEIVRDYDVGLLRFVPTPIAADTLELQCTITISEPLTAGDDLPFSEAIDQRLLLEYMKSRAYRKQDAETEDLTRANNAQSLYDAGVVKRESELRKYRRSAGVVRAEY